MVSAMPYIFPVHLFRPTGARSGIVENVISGGRALSGDEDVISADGGGRWQVTYSGINLRTPEMIRKWDAWSAYLAGGARAIYAPVYSLVTAPRPVAGGGLARPSSIYADDAYFPTEVRFGAPYIVASLTADAALRTTTISLTVTQGARVQGGEKFSIGGRSHVIERVTFASGQNATCAISPPLRAAASAGAELNFDWPIVQARLALGQDLSPDLQFGRAGGLSLTFVEDFSDAA